MRLFQDTAGTIPAAVAGHPVARIDRAAGTVDLLQGTTARRPTLARHPRGGVRNLARGAQALNNTTYWPVTAVNSGVTATKVGTGVEGGMPYVDVRWQGTATATTLHTGAYGFSHSRNPAAAGQVFSARVTARVLAGAPLSGSGLRVNIAEENTAGGFLGEAFGSFLTGHADATSSVTRTLSNENTAQVRLALTLGLKLNEEVDVTYRIKGLSLDRGAEVGPVQHNYGANDIAEPGVQDIWHLAHDAVDDDLTLVLPVGTYGRMWVDALGNVSADTLTVTDGGAATPVWPAGVTRIADIAIRAGAFSVAEISANTQYWKGLYA